MEVGSCNSQVCKTVVSSMVEVALLDSLFLVGRSLIMTGSLLKDLIESSGLPSTNRFPINELHKKEKPGPENTDGSDTEDDDEEDGVEDQDDDGDEDYSGEEGGEDDEEGDPEDDAEVNGEGGSDDGEDDDDDDEDDDDEDGDEDADGDEDEEDEEEEDQPPSKKRK